MKERNWMLLKNWGRKWIYKNAGMKDPFKELSSLVYLDSKILASIRENIKAINIL